MQMTSKNQENISS